MVTAPLLNKGVAVGVLKILSRNARAFNPLHIQTLQIMAGLIGSALAHQIHHETMEQLLTERTKMLDYLKKAEIQLQYQAYHDYLTDLPNRALFHDKLLVAMNQDQNQRKLLALLYLDIDHFKTINDTLGHALGDALLQAFSERLKACIQPSHTAARFGGDEFVLLLDNLENEQVAVQIAQMILAKAEKPYQLLTKELKIITSIGLAFFRDENISADALLSRADQALYAAKKAGRNTLTIFKKSPANAPELLT